MMIKLDLEKAYDILQWSFNEIIHPLIKALILSCITSTSISVMLNGEKMENFKPNKGIKQGCPFPFTYSSCVLNTLEK